jgi:uncharacterized protein (DUF58 family)
VDDHSETRSGRTFTGTRTRGATVTRYATQRTGLAASADAGRQTLGRVGAALRRARNAVTETVRPTGWLLLGAVVVGAVAAIAWGWTEGWIVAICASILLLLCAPFLLGKQTYTVGLEFERDRVVAGEELAAALSVQNVGKRVALPALLDIPVGEGLVEAHIPLLRANAEHAERLEISAARRGVIAVGPMTIGRGDPLGILQREHTWPDVQHVYVHPVTLTVPSTSAGLLRDLEGATTKTIVDSDLSFHAIRDYMRGDSRRHIHWKSTAKTGRLMVRQYEETRRSRIAITMDLDPEQYSTDDEFEIAVSCAGSLGLQAIRDGREIVITTSAEIPPHARGNMHAIRTLPTLTPIAMLDGMSGIERSEDVMPLEEVARMTAQDAGQLSLVFMIVGSLTPVARLRKAAVGFPSDVTVIAVRCDPGAEPSVRTARELRVMTLGMLHDLGHIMLRAAI